MQPPLAQGGYISFVVPEIHTCTKHQNMDVSYINTPPAFSPLALTGLGIHGDMMLTEMRQMQVMSTKLAPLCLIQHLAVG